MLLLKGLYLCLGLDCPSNPRRSHHQNFPDITGAWSSGVSVLVPFCLSVVHRDRNFTFFNLHCSHTSDLRVLGLSCPLAVSLSCSFPSCPRPPASHHWLYPICSWNFDYFLLCIINSSLQYFIQWACFFGGKTFNSVLHDMILVFFSSSILFLL